MAFLVTNYRWGGSIYRRWVGSFLCGGGKTLRDYGYVEKIGRGILRSNRRLRDLNRRELDIKDLGAEVRVVLHDS